MDRALFIRINQSHILPMNQLMVLLTNYGREIVWSIVGVALALKGGKAGRKAAIIMFLTVLVLIPTGIIAKQLVARPRPVVPDNDFLIAADLDFAFPSGHALITSAFAAVLLAMFRSSRKQMLFSILMSIEAALVCFSRVYVGAHYPLDVVGGIILGTGMAMLLVAWQEQLDKRVFQRIYKSIAR